MSLKFQKKIENFVCKYCHAKVKGTGYTNHCPKCLHSRHVDVNPGDRAEKCKGRMQPVSVELKQEKYVLTHQCQKCGAIRKCKTLADDNIEESIKLFKNLAKRVMF